MSLPARSGKKLTTSEILGWTHERAAWFALIQRRYADVVNTARAGQAIDGTHSVVVQLMAQEAKALGRMGNVSELRAVLERGHQVPNQFPPPARVILSRPPGSDAKRSPDRVSPCRRSSWSLVN
ncbi:MAG: hypothetical protein ABJA34_13550 [Pseudonocardiales bacterium]